MNRRQQNMRKNRRDRIKRQNVVAKQKHEQKRQEPLSELDKAIGEGLLAFCASIALGTAPKKEKKLEKQIQGPKQNEIELEPGVYLSDAH